MSTKIPETEPGELVIATSADRVLVRIRKDGTIVYGEDYTPDEAAKVLWEAVARQRQEDETRRILFSHLEHLLQQLGEQDLRYEACQKAARAPKASAHDKFQEERAANQWEMLIHQVVEFARGFALQKRQAPERSDLN